MKRFILILLGAALLSCTAPEERTIATVVGEKITQGEFDQEVTRLTKAMLPPDYTLTDEESKMFNAQILNTMIQKKMYTQKLDELEIESDDRMVDMQFNQMMMTYGSEEKMKAEVESKGFTIEELREEFKYQTRLNGLSQFATEQDIEISNDEQMAYYTKNRETIFEKHGMVDLCRHILLKIVDGDNEATLKKISNIREEIKSGLSFSEAALKHSEGPTGENGGQLPPFKEGEMVKEFSDVAFSLPLNEVSEPVLTQFGYHLIVVEERTESEISPFEEAQSFIESQLKKEKFFTMIEDDAKISKPDWAKTE